MPPQDFIAAGIEPFSEDFNPKPLADYVKAAKGLAQQLIHVYLEQRGAVECYAWLTTANIVRDSLVRIQQGRHGRVNTPEYRNAVVGLKRWVEILHSDYQEVLALVGATYPVPPTRKHPEIVYPVELELQQRPPSPQNRPPSPQRRPGHPSSSVVSQRRPSSPVASQRRPSSPTASRRRPLSPRHRQRSPSPRHRQRSPSPQHRRPSPRPRQHSPPPQRRQPSPRRRQRSPSPQRRPRNPAATRSRSRSPAATRPRAHHHSTRERAHNPVALARLVPYIPRSTLPRSTNTPSLDTDLPPHLHSPSPSHITATTLEPCTVPYPSLEPLPFSSNPHPAPPVQPLHPQHLALLQAFSSLIPPAPNLLPAPALPLPPPPALPLPQPRAPAPQLPHFSQPPTQLSQQTRTAHPAVTSHLSSPGPNLPPWPQHLQTTYPHAPNAGEFQRNYDLSQRLELREAECFVWRNRHTSENRVLKRIYERCIRVGQLDTAEQLLQIPLTRNERISNAPDYPLWFDPLCLPPPSNQLPDYAKAAQQRGAEARNHEGAARR